MYVERVSQDLKGQLRLKCTEKKLMNRCIFFFQHNAELGAEGALNTFCDVSHDRILTDK